LYVAAGLYALTVCYRVNIQPLRNFQKKQSDRNTMQQEIMKFYRNDKLMTINIICILLSL